MFNSNRKTLYITISAIILFSISFTIGYLLMRRDSPENVADDRVEKNQPNIEIVGEKNVITPNTFIEKRTHYNECKHVETSIGLAEEAVVNMARDEYEDYLHQNTNFQLISFSETKITLWGERNHLCTNHYVIGEEGGYIAVYGIDENGNRVLQRVFDNYHIDMLQDLDRENIIKGIVVNSQEELSEILENFIS